MEERASSLRFARGRELLLQNINLTGEGARKERVKLCFQKGSSPSTTIISVKSQLYLYEAPSVFVEERPFVPPRHSPPSNSPSDKRALVRL